MAAHPAPGRVTITDVAAQAGVSIKSVSRVLNNERYVSADIRKKVNDAICALNFRPSAAARSLAGRRHFQIGLICDNPSPNYVYELQAGIRSRCDVDGVRMIAQPFDRKADRPFDLIEALVGTIGLDGIILTPPACDDAKVLSLLRRRTIPMVLVSPALLVASVPATFIANEQAAMIMTRHLFALGHRRIGFVSGDPDYETSRQRLRGYHAAHREAGVPVDPALEMRGSYDFASGSRAGVALLSMPDRPTAIFASSDEMAAGVLSVAHRMGVRVPEQCSIAGFGDDPLASYVWPALTSVRQPTRQLGWNAADLLLSETGGATEHRELPHELMLRNSTGPTTA